MESLQEVVQITLDGVAVTKEELKEREALAKSEGKVIKFQENRDGVQVYVTRVLLRD